LIEHRKEDAMYRLTEAQQAIVERARAIAEASIGPQASRVDEEGIFPIDGLTALGRAGFLGLTVSPEFGGMGQGFRVVCATLDEIGQRCASTGMVYLMHLVVEAVTPLRAQAIAAVRP
jgi:alkylation response protein AidB-like acyl-CoA dehydrogenase